jgi:hypothetical protein
MRGRGFFNAGGLGKSKKGRKLAVKNAPNFILSVNIISHILCSDRDISAINATAQRALDRAISRMESLR